MRYIITRVVAPEWSSHDVLIMEFDEKIIQDILHIQQRVGQMITAFENEFQFRVNTRHYVALTGPLPAFYLCDYYEMLAMFPDSAAELIRLFDETTRGETLGVFDSKIRHEFPQMAGIAQLTAELWYNARAIEFRIQESLEMETLEVYGLLETFKSCPRQYASLDAMVKDFLMAAELPELTAYASQHIFRATPSWAAELHVPELSVVVKYPGFLAYVPVEHFTLDDIERVGLNTFPKWI